MTYHRLALLAVLHSGFDRDCHPVSFFLLEVNLCGFLLQALHVVHPTPVSHDLGDISISIFRTDFAS